MKLDYFLLSSYFANIYYYDKDEKTQKFNYIINNNLLTKYIFVNGKVFSSICTQRRQQNFRRNSLIHKLMISIILFNRWCNNLYIPQKTNNNSILNSNYLMSNIWIYDRLFSTQKLCFYHKYYVIFLLIMVNHKMNINNSWNNGILTKWNKN